MFFPLVVWHLLHSVYQVFYLPVYLSVFSLTMYLCVHISISACLSLFLFTESAPAFPIYPCTYACLSLCLPVFQLTKPAYVAVALQEGPGVLACPHQEADEVWSGQPRSAGWPSQGTPGVFSVKGVTLASSFKFPSVSFVLFFSIYATSLSALRFLSKTLRF